MLAVVFATLLSADVEWCNTDCFARAHPLAARIGLARFVGGVDITYALLVGHVAGKPGGISERVQVGWAVPISEVLEVDSGVSLNSAGQFELVPGARYAMVKVDGWLVIAFAANAALSLQGNVLRLTAWPGFELHLGPIALALLAQLDVSGRTPAGIWTGMVIGL